jgi:two-component system sensor histidine kinase TctE
MTRIDSFSIRRRVFVVALSLLACSAVALVLFLHNYAERAADQAFDRLLGASALTIAGAVQVENKDVTVELPFAALAMLSGSERVFYTVRDPAGNVVTGYADLDASLPMATSSVATFSDSRYHGDRIRVASVGRLISATQHAGWATIRVAETRGAREQLAAEILNRSAVPLIVIVVVALGLLWFGIERAFAPFAMIERELRGREPDDLEPLFAPAPREVLRLVEALNAFMLRLRTLMGTLNGLVADAAHQIRTPLASVRAQAEVALEETDPERLRARVVRIHANAAHASQLINQLLMDATIAHRLGMQGRAAVGVVELINETRRRFGSIEPSRLRIAIAPEVRRARLRGDRVALREMLRNLVDNALQYAPDGPVDIEARALSGGRVTLTIADRGPGIEEDEKNAVLERFTRGRSAHSKPGSGLGLAIVRSVVDAHGGVLSLRDRAGGGLSVSVILPLAAAARPRINAMLMLLLSWVALTGGVPTEAHAQAPVPPPDIVTRFPATQGTGGPILTVASPTDTPLFSELVRSFQESRPDVTVVYHEMGTSKLYDEAAAGHLSSVDVLISTAVDLQIKLANDGFAMRYVSPYAAKLPPWAIWRSEVFGFTFEPAVIVYNPKRFTPETVPRSRHDLLALLERDPARLYDRIGTYDIAASSAGYLLAEQDELVSSDFWGLANALGQAHVHLRSTSASILDEIEQGRLDLGYNVLGSYALARQAANHDIGVVIPEDYVLVLARAALIARQAPHPALSRAFIDWLLSPAGQRFAASHAGLGAIMEGTPGPWTITSTQGRSKGPVQPIVFGPALLVGLDRLRHGRFVQNWIRLVTDSPKKATTGR